MEGTWTKRIYGRFGFTKSDILEGARALDVGCGGRKLPGAKGMDRLPLPGVDIVHDFDQMPWPLAEHSFDLVFFNHALEHATDVVSVLHEAHRVLKPDGRLVVQVPYFRSTDAFADPTHKHFFTSTSLDYFIVGEGLAHYAYSDRLFEKKGFWYGWPQPSKNPFVNLIKSFFLRHPMLYDQYLSLVLPTRCLTWELAPVK